MRSVLVGVFIIAAGYLLPAAQVPPTVTETARLRLEIAALKQQLSHTTASLHVCQGQVAPTAYRNTMEAIEKDIAAVVREFETAHPGWTLDAKGQPISKGGP